MPMDQQQQLMAQQMVPQQMVPQQMVAQPGSINGMSPHPSMVANQNHIQEKWMEILKKHEYLVFATFQITKL